ncbi:MAG: Two-component system sensor histidine kinase, partial [uncultured Acetobacteraceae bacterium]
VVGRVGRRGVERRAPQDGGRRGRRRAVVVGRGHRRDRHGRARPRPVGGAAPRPAHLRGSLIPHRPARPRRCAGRVRRHPDDAGPLPDRLPHPARRRRPVGLGPRARGRRGHRRPRHVRRPPRQHGTQGGGGGPRAAGGRDEPPGQEPVRHRVRPHHHRGALGRDHGGDGPRPDGALGDPGARARPHPAGAGGKGASQGRPARRPVRRVPRPLRQRREGRRPRPRVAAGGARGRDRGHDARPGRPRAGHQLGQVRLPVGRGRLHRRAVRRPGRARHGRLDGAGRAAGVRVRGPRRVREQAGVPERGRPARRNRRVRLAARRGRGLAPVQQSPPRGL